ncbi:MAG: VOC family protein [Paucibacter sp.]|nr:VOC family protein [Roseateles sp.]
MIDHLSLLVSDFAKSKTFYSQALTPVGHSRLVELPASVGGHGPSAGFCHVDGSDLWITEGGPTHPPVHIAFRVSSRAAVDAFYQAAIEAGGRDNGPPGLRPRYHPNYYGAYVLDPDGNNIEAVCHEAQ